MTLNSKDDGASVAILDITGVAVVDTQVANALLLAAKAVQPEALKSL